MSEWVLHLGSAAQTRRFGEDLGRLLGAGDVVLLRGELGAGKTCLTQGLARGLGVPEDEPVSSPSYTLMNHHRGRLDLYHFDLYRLADADELIELGFEEYLHGHGVTVVEWYDRMDELPITAVRIDLSYEGEDIRKAILHVSGKRSLQIIEKLRETWEGY